MKRDAILTIKLPSSRGMEEFPVHEPRVFERGRRWLPRMS
jgi:hypothetical protein